MYYGKKELTDARDTMWSVKLQDNPKLGDWSEVGFYDVEITSYLKEYPLVNEKMNVRFFVNYACTAFDNDLKGAEPNFRGDGFWVYETVDATVYLGSKGNVFKWSPAPMHRAEICVN